MWYSYDQKKYIVEVEKEPVKIDYVTESGRGTITMDPARVFPCTVHDIKLIIDTLWKSADPYGTAGNIAEYLRACIQDTKTYRAQFQECPRNARIITELSSLIKKYVSNLDKLACAFGLESVTDQQVKTMKMAKCEVLLVEQKNGEYIIKSYPGKQFEKSGLVFQVCQKEKKGARYISIPGTGRMLTYYRGTEKEAPANISEDNINVIKKNIENGRIKAFCSEFAEICNNNGVTFPGVLPCYDLPETAEPETVETAEPETVEQIKTVLSAFDDRYNEFYTKYTGGVMYARLIEYGEKLLTYETIIPGFTKGQTRRFLKGLIQARGDYFTSDREVAALASVVWETFNQQTEPAQTTAEPATVSEPIQGTTEPAKTAEPITAEKTAENTPETVTDRKPAQVWKPCTMTVRRKNAIIKCGFVSANRQQNPGQNDRVKAILRLAKSQRYINLHPRHKNPATGKIQAHNGYIIGTAYTPEPIPGKPPRSLNYYGIVNRRVPRFEIRGSPILHDKKIGGFCGVYIRPPGGYLKVSILKT